MSTLKQPHDLSPSPDLTHDIPLDALLMRLRELTSKLDELKPLYAESDALILELARRGFTHSILPDGTHAQLMDNFVDSHGAPKLTAWKSCGVKRFDVDFTDEASAARSAKRAEAKARKELKS